MQRLPRDLSRGRALTRSRSPSPSRPRPRFFRRSPARSPPKRPPMPPPPPEYYRARSPSPAPAYHARPPPPRFYRRSPSAAYRSPSPAHRSSSSSQYRSPPSPPYQSMPPPAFRRQSPPRFAERPSPPRLPPRAHSQPRFRLASPRRSRSRSPPRSPARAPARSRSEWRRPPAAATAFQRGKSLARDDALASAKRPPPHRNESLAQRVTTLDAFCAEVLDADGKLLPSSKRPRSPGMPIPVPLLHGETLEHFEAKFRKWLLRKNLTIDDLRGDAGKERVLRFSYAYFRLPAGAWVRPKALKSPVRGGEPDPRREDPRLGPSDSSRLAAAAMPPRAKPFKRGRSVGPMLISKSEPGAELAPELKRVRKEAPRDPRVRAAAPDGGTTSSPRKDPQAPATTAVSGDDIDGVPISDDDAATTHSAPPRAEAPATLRANGSAKDEDTQGKTDAAAKEAAGKARPTTETTPAGAKTAQIARAPAQAPPARANAIGKAGGQSTQSSSKQSTSTGSSHFDENTPKWAVVLLKSVRNLEHEVRALRRQLSAQQPGATAASTNTTKAATAGAVGTPTDRRRPDPARAGDREVPEPQAAGSTAPDPAKLRLVAAYNDLNDEILLNEKAVAESEQFVASMMETDERQGRELQAQLQELSSAIESEKAKRDVALAELIAHCWRDRPAELEALLAAPLVAGDDVQRASHAKCASLAAQIKRQRSDLAESRRTETTAPDGEGMSALSAGIAEVERQQEAEFATLLGASERVREAVRSLRQPTS